MLTRRTFTLGAAINLLGLDANAQHSKVGGPVIAGFRGTSSRDSEVDFIRRALADGQISGVILLERNVVSPEQVAKLALSLRDAAGSFKPIISIDQEGGAVARLGQKNGFLNWMSASEAAYSFQDETALYNYYLSRARELSGVGINLNFGPVVDLNINPLNPIIGALDRSYSPDPDVVVRCASAFVKAHHDAGILSCVKHYPGHGSSTADSHMERVDVNSTWAEIELSPFSKMADEGLIDSLMISHLVHERFSDQGGTPSSLSRKSVETIRKDIGFTGAIFTDDMQMRAISSFYTESEAAVKAIQSGATFLIYANFRRDSDVGTVLRIDKAINRAADDGQISAKMLRDRNQIASDFFARLN